MGLIQHSQAASRSERCSRPLGEVADASPDAEQRLGYGVAAYSKRLPDSGHGHAIIAELRDAVDQSRGKFNAARASCLHGRCSPLAVFPAVVPVVVPSVERGPRWAFAHVGQEILEVSPARIDGYAPAAPVSVTRVVRVRAAPEHVRPAIPGSRCTRPGLVSVLSRPGYSSLCFEASTAFMLSCPEHVPAGVSSVPAATEVRVTQADPVCSAVLSRPFWVSGYHPEPFELLAGHIRCAFSSHKPNYRWREGVVRPWVSSNAFKLAGQNSA